jgi:UDP:flavonoid glycosyltransferase YjiC (YdhE family)
MKTVAVIWELGGGLGHVARLTPIIAALHRAGHRVSVVARHPRRMADAFPDLARDRLELVPAPVLRVPPIEAAPVETMADALAEIGYARSAAVLAVAEAWTRLFERLRPDVIVSDFSPIGNLAGRRFAPIVVVGSGYAIPPRGPCVPLRGAALGEASRARERQVIDAFDRAASAIGAPPAASVGDALRGSTDFVLTFAPLDPYGGHRAEPVLTPYTLPKLARRPDFRQRPERSVFLYLPALHPQLDAVMAAVRAEGLVGWTFLGNGGGAPVSPQRLQPLQVLEKPADLADLLPAVQLLIHTGGLGMAHAGMLAGNAQLLFPTNLEQELTAVTLAKHGVAAVFRSSAPLGAAPVREAIQSSLGTPAVAERLGRMAEACPRDGERSLALVLQAIERAFGGGGALQASNSKGAKRAGRRKSLG